MKIDPDTLKEVRRLRGLSRAQLADKSKLSERQIQRLESRSTKSSKSHEGTLLSLSRALSVEPGLLIGLLPLPDLRGAPRREHGERRQLSTSISPSARLAFELIKRRYGVSPSTIINMAPLAFVLLAEGSLVWRREKIAEVYETIDRMYALGGAGGHLAFAKSVYRAENAAVEEEKSINSGDLFGEHVGEDTYELGYDRTVNNPLADYIRKLAQDLDRPDIVELDPDGDTQLGYPSDGFPDYQICRDELDEICGSSGWAKYALEFGYSRLSDIPQELWEEDKAEQRAAWLEQQVPKDVKDLSRLQLPDDLDAGVPK
jgi:transcriptional regulator with XRE-family HTH domain